MRQIKFRSWHKELRDGDTVLPGWMNYDPEYGQYATVMQETRDEIGHINPVTTALAKCKVNSIFSNSNLMQFTGLLDKNGVEIYEGDILQDGSWRGAVSFEESTNNGGYDGWWQTDFIGWVASVSSLLEVVRDGCEVIGNIYESPDLLTNTEK